eukprot:SAG25_NODE_1131_length_3849_cov_109.947822_2_plen_74_part_00
MVAAAAAQHSTLPRQRQPAASGATLGWGVYGLRRSSGEAAAAGRAGRCGAVALWRCGAVVCGPSAAIRSVPEN